MIHYHFVQCDTRICRIGVSLGLDMLQNRRLKATASTNVPTTPWVI